jgi:excisionase family DNA binding protein
MDELYTIREVAEKLKISISSVYRYVENGSFPHTKIGTNIRFNQQNIESFLAGKSEKTEPVKANAPTPAELQMLYDTL